MPNTSTFNQDPFNQWPFQPDSPAVSKDKNYLRGLIHKVAFEFDANADGGITDEEGDREEDWQQVPGLEEVDCRLTIRRPKDVELGDRPSATMEWKIQLGQEIVVDRRNRAVWIDRSTGAARYGYIVGRIVTHYALDGTNPHHWNATAYENPI